MSTFKGFLFSATEEFANFARLHGGLRAEGAPYQLYRLSHNGRPDALALRGFVPQRADFAGNPLHFESRERQLHLGEQHWQVDDVAESPTLQGFVALRPAAPRRPASAMFWLQNSPLLPELVRRALALGNDRLDYAVLDDGTVLLRMAEPSFFLLQCYQQELPIYTPQTENLYLPFGMDYPLADLWQAGEHRLN